MRTVLAIVSLVFAANAFADIQLKPVPTGHDQALGTPAGTIPCDQIVTALADLQTKMTAHETSLTAFLGQVSQGLRDWNAQLSPLEGKTQTIPAGTFSVLLDAADKTDAITNDAYDNTDYVTTQMANIVSAARGCSITASPQALK